MRRAIVLGWCVGVLVILNGMILQKERVLAEGRLVFLELQPRDPRSLMQGDYMILRYSFGDRAYLPEGAPLHGALVGRVDPRGVATFARFAPVEPRGEEEVLLRYAPSVGDRRRARVAAESYLFQEGTAAEFQRARYAAIRVAADGTTVLAGLRDASFQPLGAR